MNFCGLVRNSRTAVAVLGIILYLSSTPGFAQKMDFSPTCGQAGVTKVCVTGSGWAEPSPVCYYRFYFDGAQVVFPDQPDGLFGPPRRSFTVPAGAAAGDHPIKVDLRITSNNQLLQSKQSGDLFFDFTFPFFHFLPSFKVVASIPDPWAATTATGASLNSNFNPTNVCDVSPCTKLVFIQVYRQFAINNNGTEMLTLDSFWGLPAGRDTDFTADKFVLDRIFGKKVPYYHDGVGAGSSVDPIKAATTDDAPNQVTYPAGIKAIRIEFETAVFCASGDDKGRYFGRVLWKFEQNNTQAAGTVTIVGKDRQQPSANFIAAVNQWLANPTHRFSLPTPATLSCP